MERFNLCKKFTVCVLSGLTQRHCIGFRYPYFFLEYLYYQDPLPTPMAGLSIQPFQWLFLQLPVLQSLFFKNMCTPRHFLQNGKIYVAGT